jgi:GH35 family endo-1,4-beta-xylanase
LLSLNLSWINKMNHPNRSGNFRYSPKLRRWLNVEKLEDRTTPAAGIGLQAQIYDNINLTNLLANRTDGTVDFNWGTGSPATNIAADTFSVRWSGQVEAKYTEATTFTVTGDDGYRLWVNGQVLINRWVDQAPTATSGTINLVAGRRYEIVLEYFENGGAASVKLEWQSASQPRQVVPAGQLFPAERGVISRDVWNNVNGTSVANLTANAGYPNAPTTSGTRTLFEAPSNVGDNYGQRMQGLLHVPATGAYTFFVAGDDNCELYLSNSADPAGRQRIATVPGWSAARQWTKYPQQRSATIQLAAGQAYYIEALMKEGSGGDNLAVGWFRPGTTATEVIPGEFLSAVRPTVSLFAENPNAPEGGTTPARFSVTRTGPTTNALTVRYTTRGSATSGADYTALSGTITIPAGQASAVLNISPLADTAREGTEQAVIELLEGSGYDVGRMSERTATASIQDDVDAPAGGTSLWAGTALSSFAAFGGTFTELTDPARGPVIQAAISTVPEFAYFSQLRQNITSAVRTGDILFVEFWARAASRTASVDAIFEQSTEPYEKALSRTIPVGTTWTKIQIPFVSKQNFAAGGASFGFHLGQKIQTIQFAGFRVLNYGPPSNLTPPSIGLNSIEGNYGTGSTVNVSGQPFAQAYQIQTTTVPPDFWRLQGVARNQAAVAANDTLRIEFFARATAGTTPRIEFGVQRTDTYASLAYQTISPTANWTKYTVDVVAPAGFNTEGLQAIWNLGFGLQTVQIGGFTWKNISRTVELNQLPQRFPSSSYGGREGTAAWRTEADNRIAQNRMANIAVNVRDANGNPISGAVVNVRQKKQGFKFGSAINGFDNLLSNNGQNLDAAKYQAEIKRLFNTAVLENNLKWPSFEQARQLGIESADWVTNAGLYQRGHNIIWPNRNPAFYMPDGVWQQYDTVLAAQGQAAANTYLRSAIATHIQDMAQTFAGKISEWDVVNEPFANTDVMRILDGTTNGQPVANSVLLEWFRLVRQYDPNVKRVLNDYDLFANNGGNTAHRANYEAWMTLLKAGGLVEKIGEQSHYNDGNLTDITTLSGLISDYNTRFNVPIAITEFDVNTKDEQLQADYLRDYYTMAFSQPGVDQLLMWGFWTKSHWLPDAAMYRDDFSIKPNGQAYEDLVFGDWWTDTTGTTRNGQFAIRGFQGDYEIVVEWNGQRLSANAGLGTTGATVNLQFAGTGGALVPTGLGGGATGTGTATGPAAARANTAVPVAMPPQVINPTPTGPTTPERPASTKSVVMTPVETPQNTDLVELKPVTAITPPLAIPVTDLLEDVSLFSVKLNEV